MFHPVLKLDSRLKIKTANYTRGGCEKNLYGIRWKVKIGQR